MTQGMPTRANQLKVSARLNSGRIAASVSRNGCGLLRDRMAAIEDKKILDQCEKSVSHALARANVKFNVTGITSVPSKSCPQLPIVPKSDTCNELLTRTCA